MKKAPAGGHKRALVLAGGGAKGAYQIGAWKALREVGFDFDIITGCSVGAINASMIAADRFEESVELWKLLTTDMVLDIDFPDDFQNAFEEKQAMRNMLLTAVKEHAIDQHPLYELLKKIIPVDDIYASGKKFGINCVRYPSLHHLNKYTDTTPKEEWVDWVMASAACFPGMKPWKIGKEEYIDGGYYDREPVQMAIDMGATSIVCVTLHGFGVNKGYDESRANVLRIVPSGDIGSAMLFTPSHSKRILEMGYEDTLRAFGIHPETKEPLYKE